MPQGKMLRATIGTLVLGYPPPSYGAGDILLLLAYSKLDVMLVNGEFCLDINVSLF